MRRILAQALALLCMSTHAGVGQAQDAAAESGAADNRASDSGGPDISGSLRLSYFTSSRDLNDVDGVPVISAELGIEQDITDNQSVEVTVRATVDDVFRDGNTRVRWNNAYWFLRTQRVDLRVGQQKIRWGKADGINPTDFFTPIDYTVTLPLEDDRYLSVPAVRTDLHINDTDSVSLVAAAGFTPTRIPWPEPSPVGIDDDEPSGWQTGLRWLHTGEQLDWSASIFRGYSTLPLLDAIDAPAAAGPRFVRYYTAIRGVGVDVARNFGPYGFRAEAAYTQPRAHGDRLSVKPSYSLVAGFDRSFDEWNFNLQAIVRHTPAFAAADASMAPSRQWAAGQNAIVHGQQKRTTYGMSARVVAEWLNDTLQTEILAVANFSPGNWFARPMLTYAVSDRTKLRIGAEYYTGASDTYFGSLERNRTAFVDLQFSY